MSKSQIKRHNAMTSDSQSLITSIQTLIELLLSNDVSTYHALGNRVAIPAKEFEDFSTWSEACYTRNCLYCNDSFELILLCWEPGQVTPIHDHGGEECWVKIVQGKFKETIYEANHNGEPVVQKVLFSTAGDLTYMVDQMGCHQLENISNTRAMSLHLYAKPITSCNIFVDDDATFQVKEMEYDAVFDDVLL